MKGDVTIQNYCGFRNTCRTPFPSPLRRLPLCGAEETEKACGKVEVEFAEFEIVNVRGLHLAATSHIQIAIEGILKISKRSALCTE